MATIYKKKGVWFLDYYLNGKRLRKSLKTSSKKIAELALHDLEIKLAKNDLGLFQKTINIKDYEKDFLEWKKSRIAASSYRRIELIYRLHITPFLQEHSINNMEQVTPWHIEKYVTRRAPKVKNHTLNREIIAIKEFFKMAVKWNYLQKSPAEELKQVAVRDQKPPRFLSEDEIESLLENCEGTMKLVILTALNTGLRCQELINLEWQDLDFQKNLLRVAHDERRQTKSKKTRWIPVKQSLKDEFLKHKQQQNTVEPTQKIFLSNNGNPMTCLRENLAIVYKNSRIQNSSVHTLRHTFASHLVMYGVDLYTVSKLLGHSDIKTTQIYAHLAPDHLKAAVERLPEFGHPKATHQKSQPIYPCNSMI